MYTSSVYGLPHSAICGSKDVCSSPQLFAAYRGLLRRTAPRHPPQTSFRLTIFSFPRLCFQPHIRYLHLLPFPNNFKDPAYHSGTLSILSVLDLGQNRVELLTPALSERCSNQLSYCPVLDYRRIYCLREGTGKERKQYGNCSKTEVFEQPPTHTVSRVHCAYLFPWKRR